MEIKEAKLLRIFVGELDKIGRTPLYEKIVYKAKENRLAGATVLRGIMSYGPKHVIHTSKLLSLSEDLPVIIEILDEESKINGFLPVVQELLTQAQTGGMSTIEHVQYISYPFQKTE